MLVFRNESSHAFIKVTMESCFTSSGRALPQFPSLAQIGFLIALGTFFFERRIRVSQGTHMHAQQRERAARLE